jgi:hypothetical protein
MRLDGCWMFPSSALADNAVMPAMPFDRVTRKRHPTTGMELLAFAVMLLALLGHWTQAGLTFALLVLVQLYRQVRP